MSILTGHIVVERAAVAWLTTRAVSQQQLTQSYTQLTNLYHHRRKQINQLNRSYPIPAINPARLEEDILVIKHHVTNVTISANT